MNFYNQEISSTTFNDELYQEILITTARPKTRPLLHFCFDHLKNGSDGIVNVALTCPKVDFTGNITKVHKCCPFGKITHYSKRHRKSILLKTSWESSLDPRNPPKMTFGIMQLFFGNVKILIKNVPIFTKNLSKYELWENNSRVIIFLSLILSYTSLVMQHSFQSFVSYTLFNELTGKPCLND